MSLDSLSLKGILIRLVDNTCWSKTTYKPTFEVYSSTILLDTGHRLPIYCVAYCKKLSSTGVKQSISISV